MPDHRGAPTLKCGSIYLCDVALIFERKRLDEKYRSPIPFPVTRL
jgi:hypothetical protein